MLSKIRQLILDKSYRRGVLINRGILKVDDEEYIKELYNNKFGYVPDLQNPITFNEKLQWLKLNDRDSRYSSMVDKYDVKSLISNIIGEKYIVPNLGVWDRFESIDFERLPNQFVLKCTHDSGGLAICRDKRTFDTRKAKEKIQKSLHTNYYLQGREWPYKNVKPRILAEEYLEEINDDSGGNKGLTDYKFFCFNSEPLLLYISRGLEHHPTAEISFYSMDGQEMPFHRSDYKPFHNAVMPNTFAEMKNIAHTLALFVDSPFVRIDLYSINDKVYFSEITFSPCSGMIPFEPLSADYELGKMLILPKSDN